MGQGKATAKANGGDPAVDADLLMEKLVFSHGAELCRHAHADSELQGPLPYVTMPDHRSAQQGATAHNDLEWTDEPLHAVFNDLDSIEKVRPIRLPFFFLSTRPGFLWRMPRSASLSGDQLSPS